MTHRVAMLQAAADLVTGEREEDYGSPAVSFQKIADRWSQTLGMRVTPAMVCLLMIDLKVARLTASPDKLHHDSLLDVAGYAALASEMSDD